jgi:hypothetical protein
MGDASDFVSRMTELAERVGIGDLVGRVIVDQRYAQIQHEALDYRHPRGGHAKYLEGPLLRDRDIFFEEVARTVLDDGGKAGMITAVESLCGSVAIEAPVLWGDLRRSGHPIVTSDGRPVYDRSPEARRLTDAELDAKARMEPMDGPLLGYIWYHVEHHTEPPPRRR